MAWPEFLRICLIGGSLAWACILIVLVVERQKQRRKP